MKKYLTWTIISYLLTSAFHALAQNNNYPSYASTQRENLGQIIPFDNRVRINSTEDQRPFVAVGLQPLRSHQVVIFVDRSLSMSTRDCPEVPGTHVKITKLGKSYSAPQAFSSRWDWCEYQVKQMAEQARSALPDGFTVVLFGSSYHIHKNMTAEGLQNIFRTRDPFGGTVLGHPLERVFSRLFPSKNVKS